VPGILKGSVQVELKSDLDDAAGPILHVVGVMIETDLSRGGHVSQGLLAGEGSIKNKRDFHD
jgi:hypothetical protein